MLCEKPINGGIRSGEIMSEDMSVHLQPTYNTLFSRKFQRNLCCHRILQGNTGLKISSDLQGLAQIEKWGRGEVSSAAVVCSLSYEMCVLPV